MTNAFAGEKIIKNPPSIIATVKATGGLRAAVLCASANGKPPPSRFGGSRNQATLFTGVARSRSPGLTQPPLLADWLAPSPSPSRSHPEARERDASASAPERAPAQGSQPAGQGDVHRETERERVRESEPTALTGVLNGRVLIGPRPRLGTSGCPRVEFPPAAIVAPASSNEITTTGAVGPRTPGPPRFTRSSVTIVSRAVPERDIAEDLRKSSCPPPVKNTYGISLRDLAPVSVEQILADLGEGLKGLTGAQDPAPKGLDLLRLRFTVHAREGGSETASRVEKDVIDADLISVPRTKMHADVFSAAWLFGIGSRERRACPQTFVLDKEPRRISGKLCGFEADRDAGERVGLDAVRVPPYFMGKENRRPPRGGKFE
ncbi:hypothetical protein WN55_08299 [Dufourea novaeangliae]|uniref:Uncharacterized protein n=1 Tax=Dufourea novaeangliae TaxID=178035 RepID=A0A154P8I7_DUFNO|nr:hypothetical protein WN55_08299 [Dufourea novaeangliae]